MRKGPWFGKAAGPMGHSSSARGSRRGFSATSSGRGVTAPSGRSDATRRISATGSGRKIIREIFTFWEVTNPTFTKKARFHFCTGWVICSNSWVGMTLVYNDVAPSCPGAPPVLSISHQPRQRVEQPKSKSTQPYCPTRWPSLYIYLVQSSRRFSPKLRCIAFAAGHNISRSG